MVLHVYYLRRIKHVFIIQVDGWSSRHSNRHGVRGMGGYRCRGDGAAWHFCISRACYFLAVAFSQLARFFDRGTANHHFPSLEPYYKIYK